ncbi:MULTISPECIES: RES family NAD+ phosphorylase [Pseudomonas]|uniref:RES family NAD+ phosphorylase n=1 Tax=Pseudomonas aphyarum TaxID=2942629 RepID=A0ABT5PGZ1_9PSED|nr:RES family NAD+ phosphorylase [Pseudomonas aphyarum]MDD0967738.1 RES family NAD+ phosphorylase [Pseudomonas aphyarum]MDD1123049.1 RES family NAD+ phosphorylase [Pseudomonas aphyarum]
MSSRVCSLCVTDTYLKDLIHKMGESQSECDFCELRSTTLELDELAPLFEKMLEDYYECSSLSAAVVVYDYPPDGEIIDEIFQNFILPEPAKELAELVSDGWFDWSSHEHRFGEDPHFIRSSSLPVQLNREWYDLDQSLRSSARLVNPFVAGTLEKIFSPLFNNITTAAIITAGPDQLINTLFRARVFQSAQRMKIELSHPERALGPPPSKLATAGRMNAKGIPVFYGATHKHTAISEVRPPVGSFVATCSFTLTRDLRLLDLRELSEVEPPPNLSLFDPATRELDARYRFLKLLEGKLTMPIMPEAADEGYLITQAIADFLATHPKLNIDGLVFSSSQTDTDGPTGCNIILFTKAASVCFSAESEKGSSHFELWEFDDESDSSWISPCLHESLPPQEDLNQPFQTLLPALRLNRESLAIHEVTGVSYRTDEHSVYLRN